MGSDTVNKSEPSVDLLERAMIAADEGRLEVAAVLTQFVVAGELILLRRAVERMVDITESNVE